MIKLLNSAMMPQEGIYKAQKITPEQARRVFEHFSKSGWVSYVGYPQTAEYMSKVLGVEVPVNRAQATLDNDDIILVCKLKYRLSNPADKGAEVPENAFEWWVVEYHSFENELKTREV